MRHRQYASLGKLVRRFKRFQPKLNVAAVGLLLVVSSVAANVATGWTCPTTTTPTDDATVKLAANYGKLPLTFEANVGQTDSQVKFLNRTGSTTTYFTPTETVFLRSYGQHDDASPTLPETTPTSDTPTAPDILRMSLKGANPTPTLAGLDQQASTSNYFIGNNQADWHTNVPNYDRVHYSQVYPSIDLVYYGSNSSLEHDFVVAPGAEPNQIAIHFTGTKEMSVDQAGNLVLTQNGGTTTFTKPYVY